MSKHIPFLTRTTASSFATSLHGKAPKLKISEGARERQRERQRETEREKEKGKEEALKIESMDRRKTYSKKEKENGKK